MKLVTPDVALMFRHAAAGRLHGGPEIRESRLLPTTPAFKEAPPDSFKETADWKFAKPGQQRHRFPAKWWETVRRSSAHHARRTGGRREPGPESRRGALPPGPRADSRESRRRIPGNHFHRPQRRVDARFRMNRPYFPLPAHVDGRFRAALRSFLRSRRLGTRAAHRERGHGKRRRPLQPMTLATATLSIPGRAGLRLFSRSAAPTRRNSFWTIR